MKPCKQCGAMFTPHREGCKGQPQLYCSPKCRQKASMAAFKARECMCECKRGVRVSRHKGCAKCEEENERYYAAKKQQEERREQAQQREIEDGRSMSRFARLYNLAHRTFTPRFNT